MKIENRGYSPSVVAGKPSAPQNTAVESFSHLRTADSLYIASFKIKSHKDKGKKLKRVYQVICMHFICDLMSHKADFSDLLKKKTN